MMHATLSAAAVGAHLAQRPDDAASLAARPRPPTGPQFRDTSADACRRIGSRAGRGVGLVDAGGRGRRSALDRGRAGLGIVGAVLILLGSLTESIQYWIVIFNLRVG